MGFFAAEKEIYEETKVVINLIEQIHDEDIATLTCGIEIQGIKV